MNLFTAFATHPASIRLADQGSSEQVLLFLRRHWITNLPWLLITLIGIFLPFLVLLFVHSSFIPDNYIVLSFLLYYLLLFGIALSNFVLWFYNVGIITSDRVIDIDFSDLSYKNIASALLEALKDVNYTQQGFSQTFFNYGNITVQTEANESNIAFLAVPKPSLIAKTLLDLIKESDTHEQH